jgi:hypothetical protein
VLCEPSEVEGLVLATTWPGNGLIGESHGMVDAKSAVVPLIEGDTGLSATSSSGAQNGRTKFGTAPAKTA